MNNLVSILLQVADEFYWKGLHADVKQLCQHCDRCQRTNPQLQKSRAELHPIPVTKVWHRVGIDLVGPLPETRAGNKYIITLSDYFSKWPEAAPLQTKSAEGVANFLFNTFCRHGWPKIVQSDQGREFVNEINTRLFQLTDVKQCVSSAYHPQTNGLDERFNQTLINTLKKVIDASKEDWDEHLPAALYAYRISKQASSKFTPFFLMYNRNPRKAVSFEMQQSDDVEDEDKMSEDEDVDTDGILQQLLEIRERCHSKAKENIASAQERQKKQYDAKHDALKVNCEFHTQTAVFMFEIFLKDMC